jgi:Flp pilus assembly protein TadD/4-amino-4-deoxy-L-arabinose transferase-like glycosyltransferase
VTIAWKMIVKNDRRKQKVYFAAVLIVAALFRFGHLVCLHTDPVADFLVLDSLAYDTTAKLILADKLPETIYFQAPFYPYFLAAVYSVSNNSIQVVRIIQIFLDILSVILVFRITLNLFNHKSAIIAGFTMAVYPVMIFHTGLILKTTLNTFFATLMLWLLLERRVKIKTGARLVLLGLVTGYASATQGSVLLQIPLLGLWVVVESGWRKPRVWITRILWFCIGLILSIGPFTARNYRVSGRFVLLTSQGGANFYLGNSPYSDGTSKRPPRIRVTPEHEEADFHREAERALGRKLTPDEAGKYWRNEALRWIRDNPYEAVLLQLRKLGLFWNRVEIPDNYDFDFYRRYSWFIRYPRFPFWILGSLGLTGMLFLYRTWEKTWFLYLWTVSYCLIWVVFHIYSRYRLPVVAFLVPFFAACCNEIFSMLKKRQSVKCIKMSVVFLVIFLLQALPLTSYSHAQPFFNLGAGLTRLGRLDEARQAYMDALACHPEYEPAMVNLGKLEWLQGKYERATAWWYKALQADPDSVEAHSNLGSYYAVQGNMPTAKIHFEKAVQIQPYYALGWLHLAQAEQSLGNYPKAVKAFTAFLELEPSNAQALYGKAMCLESMNRPDEAITTWKRYIETAADIPQESPYLKEAVHRLQALQTDVGS